MVSGFAFCVLPGSGGQKVDDAMSWLHLLWVFVLNLQECLLPFGGDFGPHTVNVPSCYNCMGPQDTVLSFLEATLSCLEWVGSVIGPPFCCKAIHWASVLIFHIVLYVLHDFTVF